MDGTGPAHERTSVTVARWALTGATVALVALASGATALLVVTSTTGVGLPLEESHPLPATTADGFGGFGGSADVLLLPGGSPTASVTRAGRADTGPDDLLLALRSAGSRPAATRTGRAAREAAGGPTAPTPPAGSAGAGVEVLPTVEDRPEPGDDSASERPAEDRPEKERPGKERPSRPTPTPGDTTPPAREEPADDEPARRPGRTPAAEPRPDAPAGVDGEAKDEDERDEDKAKDKAKDKDEREKDERDEDEDDRERAGREGDRGGR